MTPATGVFSSSDLAPAVQPAAMMSEAFAKDAIISWFRGEFAAANAIIDALCGHLSRLEGGRCRYESMFAAIHHRRLNWIPILQMQKYFSISDVTLELQKVADEKTELRGFEKIEEVYVSSPVKEKRHENLEEKTNDRNGGAEAVDNDFTRLTLPASEITDTGSEEVQPLMENINICTNQEDWEAWRAQIKMTKGFTAKESVKGHMVNVVRGLKVYENILTNTELTRLNDYVTKLHVAGKNGELSGETYIMYNQQSKAIKRELIQFGAPIFGQIKDESTNKPRDSHIEPIPAPLEGVIDHLIKYNLISEIRRPNSCIINFFDEGEFSQPFLKPPHLEQPISTLLLSESTMAFGRTLVCDKDGNYKGLLMLSLNEGSLLVMRGNSADMARHVMCQSPTKRISVTFFKVRIDSYEKNPSAMSAMTVWQPGVPTTYLTPSGTPNGYDSMEAISKWDALDPTLHGKKTPVWQPGVPTTYLTPSGTPNGYDSMEAISKWDALGAPQLLMLSPVCPMVPSPRRLPRGGTGVFLPWSVGSRKTAKHLPPRAQRGAQRGRLLELPAPAEPHIANSTSGSSISHL